MTAQPPIRTLIDIVTHAQAGTLREAAIPQPLKHHLQDAIAHADAYNQGWSLNDFEIISLGLLSAEEIGHYDDLSSWVEVTDADDLATFLSAAYGRNQRRCRPGPCRIDFKETVAPISEEVNHRT
jgi:hypothetical protein